MSNNMVFSGDGWVVVGHKPSENEIEQLKRAAEAFKSLSKKVDTISGPPWLVTMVRQFVGNRAVKKLS
jgi:hypothetical protein